LTWLGWGPGRRTVLVRVGIIAFDATLTRHGFGSEV
jgi:hypothetical protein